MQKIVGGKSEGVGGTLIGSPGAGKIAINRLVGDVPVGIVEERIRQTPNIHRVFEAVLVIAGLVGLAANIPVLGVGAAQRFNDLSEQIVGVVIIVGIAENIFHRSDAADERVGQASAVVGVKESGVGDQFAVDAHGRGLGNHAPKIVIGVGQLTSVWLGFLHEQVSRIRVGGAVRGERVVLIFVLPRGVVRQRHAHQVAVIIILIIDGAIIIRQHLRHPAIKVILERE